MSGEAEARIVCGTCNEPVKIRADASDDTVYSCPSCGQSDRFDAVLREAASYVAYKVINNALGKAPRFSQSGPVKVTVHRPPQRHYRWIVSD